MENLISMHNVFNDPRAYHARGQWIARRSHSYGLVEFRDREGYSNYDEAVQSLLKKVERGSDPS